MMFAGTLAIAPPAPEIKNSYKKYPETTINVEKMPHIIQRITAGLIITDNLWYTINAITATRPFIMNVIGA